MDFNKSIFENRKALPRPFIAAHRGVSGANIPCNTLLAQKIAINEGADVVEIDVTKSLDGEYFCFHPGMEPVFLKCGKYIPEMTAEEVKNTPLLNNDEVLTHYRVPLLKDVFALLKDKVYINVDKYWEDVEGIPRVIRECGVEKQVIVKTPIEDEYFEALEKHAPDFMYMGLARHTDDVTDKLLQRNINYIGIEALFDSLDDNVASEKYISSMHEKGLLVWANSILYNERDIISAGLTDDAALESGDGSAWKKLAAMKFDFIQTDWVLEVVNALKSKN